MQRFRKIIVNLKPETDNKAAVEQARIIALRNGASVKALVVTRAISDFNAVLAKASLMDVLMSQGHLEDQDVEGLLEPLRKEGIEVQVVRRKGVPFVEVIREVLQSGDQMVIETAGEPGWFKQTFFGTTDLNLLRECPCPVWIVRPAKTPRINRILAAVNSSADSPEETSINRTILQLGTSLAKRRECDLCVVHCWDIPLGAFSPTRISSAKLEKYTASFEQEVRSRFEKLLEEHSIDPRSEVACLLRGEAGFLIPKFAKENGIDMIIMGTLARSGLPGFLIGNTAEKVLEQVECSVLTIKPDNFVSPVAARDPK